MVKIKLLVSSLLILAVLQETLGQVQKFPNMQVFLVNKLRDPILETTKFNNVVNNAEINIITFVYDLDPEVCFPCLTEIEKINENLEHWRTIADFNYSVLVGTKRENDTKDSSRLYLSAFSARDYMKENEWAFPFIIDYGFNYLKALNIRGVPCTYIIDKGGNIFYSTRPGLSSESTLTEIASKLSSLQVVKPQKKNIN
ncbi:MAG: hypothetical protein JNL51_06755 [Chitinophagaceae bacterium]|nr:hypothetical protein [Chitinophagaceae bacterium]